MRVSVVQTQSHLPPWMQEHRGLRWMDMPSGDPVLKKLNFFLFRRGLYEPNLDPVSDEESGLSVDELKDAKRDARGQVLVKGGRVNRVSFGTISGLTARRAQVLTERVKERADAVDARQMRQDELLLRFVKAKQARGFVTAFVSQDLSAHSSLARALGRGRAGKGPLRTATMDRIERAFEALKKEGWNL